VPAREQPVQLLDVHREQLARGAPRLQGGPASVEICTLLRKPEAQRMAVDVKYVGYDIPDAFVVGYGLDFAEKYRNLRSIGTLAPHVYS
jgi:hypoxanthine-guanine phosphoribosyltransferase